ncbi:uncharacterized protein At1g01500-like [Phalaenopsis equestris]|uniref:uncharacterized protein At1g01500-like n=1 Tax=Phalaenopsis equestris TaxID=78828 RepID=UPI0009E26AB9|nr:uncharacterized protein At1g01500-like [Phalaenopsis equestris]
MGAPVSGTGVTIWTLVSCPKHARRARLELWGTLYEYNMVPWHSSEHPTIVTLEVDANSPTLDKDDCDEYNSEMNAVGRSYYSEDFYSEEDGQLSWFNAGVRVGVGIGLGMCIGIGIGAGLLLRSYQATTRSFRRRFF